MLPPQCLKTCWPLPVWQVENGLLLWLCLRSAYSLFLFMLLYHVTSQSAYKPETGTWSRRGVMMSHRGALPVLCHRRARSTNSFRLGLQREHSKAGDIWVGPWGWKEGRTFQAERIETTACERSTGWMWKCRLSWQLRAMPALPRSLHFDLLRVKVRLRNQGVFGNKSMHWALAPCQALCRALHTDSVC